MAVFNNMSITTKGMELYTKVQAGHELRFTKMRVGSGKFESDPVDLLDLIDGKLDVEIVKVKPIISEKKALINGIVNNTSVTSPLYICEIGLYALDPDEGEILYGYSSAGEYGDYYSPIANGPFSWSYQISVAVGNASNISITLSEQTYDYTIQNTNSNLTIINGATQADINQQIDIRFNEAKCQEAKGTAADLILDIGTPYHGQIINFWASSNSNGVNLTINTKPFYKPNTTISPTLIKDKPYTAIFDEKKVEGGCFFIKASSEGTAKPYQVLAGIPFSNEEDTGIIGTMPERGTVNKTLNCGETYNINEGHYNDGTVKAASLSSQTSANATAKDIISGKTAWVNGSKLTGTATIQSLGGLQVLFKGNITVPANSTVNIGKVGSIDGIVPILKCNNRYFGSGTLVNPTPSGRYLWWVDNNEKKLMTGDTNILLVQISNDGYLKFRNSQSYSITCVYAILDFSCINS